MRDLTQEFFAELLARKPFAQADRARARFRTFLLAALDHFLNHAHRDAHALKRGGGREFVSLDAANAEQRLALEPRALLLESLIGKPYVYHVFRPEGH